MCSSLSHQQHQHQRELDNIAAASTLPSTSSLDAAFPNAAASPCLATTAPFIGALGSGESYICNRRLREWPVYMRTTDCPHVGCDGTTRWTSESAGYIGGEDSGLEGSKLSLVSPDTTVPPFPETYGGDYYCTRCGTYWSPYYGSLCPNKDCPGKKR